MSRDKLPFPNFWDYNSYISEIEKDLYAMLRNSRKQRAKSKSLRRKRINQHNK